MSLTLPLSQETSLAGRIVQSTVTTTSDVVYAEFTDKKTGDARTPQSTTKLFVLSKDSDNFEMIWAENHTTSGGITTINIKKDGLGVVIGRNLLKYGNLSGSATGNKHAINSEIGCAETHIPVEVLNQIMRGLEGTGANTFRVGNETDSNITVYAQNADVNKPFVRYDATANKWIFSNDGVSSGDVGGGTGSVTAGDGLDMTAGVISAKGAVQVSSADTNASYLQTKLNAGDGLDESIGTPGADETLDLAVDVTDFIDTNYGLTENANDIRINLDTDSGLEFNAGKLRTKVKSGGGITRDSDGLSLSATYAPTFTGTAGETISGATVAKAVAIAPNNYKKQLAAEVSRAIRWRTGTNISVGYDDASTGAAQSFTFTDADATTITLESYAAMMCLVNSPGANSRIRLEVHTDNSGKPSGTIITNGLSTPLQIASDNNAPNINLFTFPTPPTITSGTKYWVVARRWDVGTNNYEANNTTNYYKWKNANSDIYASHGYSTYTSSTTTWQAENANDMYFIARFNCDYGGKIYNLDANNLSKCRFIGFVNEDVVASDSVSVQYAGEVNALSGLTAGDHYLASQTPGAITLSPSTGLDTVIIPIGEAISSTSLLVNKGMKWIKQQYNGVKITDGTTTQASLSLFIETGFKPIFIQASAKVIGGSNAAQVGVINAVHGSEVGVLEFDPLSDSFQTLNANTVVTATEYIGDDPTNKMTIGTIYENGFDLVFTQINLNYGFSNVYIAACGN